MGPDDPAMISIIYYLGILHGKRYGVRKTNGQAHIDRESEKVLIDALPLKSQQYASEQTPHQQKIKALLLASKTEGPAAKRRNGRRQDKPLTTKLRKQYDRKQGYFGQSMGIEHSFRLPSPAPHKISNPLRDMRIGGK